MGDVDEVKAKLDIVSVIAERVQLKKAGHNLKGLCPFHNEKSPSFMVSPERQVFHCFGCGKGGSVIDFVMEYEHVDFVEALETLADKAGVTLTKRTGDAPQQKLKETIFEVNTLASEYYHYILMKHPIGEKARLYLKNRGVTDKSIKTFGMGYSPSSWDGLTTFLEKKKYTSDILEKAGLCIRGNKGGVYDRFRGRIMFTLRDHRGKVVGFSGRILDTPVKDTSRQEAKYINTSETLVYNKSSVLFGLDVTKDAIIKANEAILMEGEFDVISSFQEGIGNAVAIKGSALTEGHVHLLKRFTERIVFALDSDFAGDAASRRGIEIAEKAGLDMRIAAIPVGKDPDEAARDNPVLLKKAIKDAVPIYEYLISSAVKRFDATTAFGKRKISEEILPMLTKIENSIVQSHYVKFFAKIMHETDEVIFDGMRKVRPTLLESVMKKEDATKEDSFAVTGPERLEVYTLGLLLQGGWKEKIAEFQEKGGATLLKHMGVKRIFELLTAWDTTGTTIQDFAKTIPKELLPVLDEAYLWDFGTLLEDPNKLEKEWNKTVHEVQKQGIRRSMREMTDELAVGDIPEEKKITLQDLLVEKTHELIALEKSE